jgi:hypothetical protein
MRGKAKKIFLKKKNFVAISLFSSAHSTRKLDLIWGVVTDG